MERLSAPAYDIDVLARDGKVLRAMPRRRLNPAGIPFTGGVLTPTKPLLTLARAHHRGIQAVLALRLRRDDRSARQRPVPIEINPRPSGSIAAAILAGVPFYDDLIALANDGSSRRSSCRKFAVIPYMDCRIVPLEQVP